MKQRLLEAVLEEESVKNTVFIGETAIGGDFSGLELENVRFERCRFADCDFSYGDFYRSEFVGCDFSNCRFLNSHWLECQVTDSKGNGAVFTGSVWKRCTVADTGLAYCNFTGCTWEELSLSDVHMANAFLNSMKLKKPKFHRTIFSGTEFFKTKLGGTDLSDCAIDGIRVSTSLEELRDIRINPSQAVDLMPLLGIKLL